MMPSNPLNICHPIVLLPSIFPSIRVFSSVSVLRIRWPKYWSFSFNISPSSEYSGFPLGLAGLISLQSKGLSRVFSRTTVRKHQFLVAQTVKSLPAMQKIQVRSLGQEDPLEESMATHSRILAWRIPWTKEPGGLQSMGSQRVGHDGAKNTFTYRDKYISTRLVYNIGSSSFPFCCFPLFLSLIAEEGFLISPCYSLKLFIQMGIPFLFSFVFSLRLQ